MNPTPVDQFINELNGGVFAEKLGALLSEVAARVVDHGKVGQIVIKLDLKQMGENHMVNVTHKLTHTAPTQRGKNSGEDTTETPMHVGKGGRMTLFPEEQVPAGQMHMLKGRSGEPMPNQ